MFLVLFTGQICMLNITYSNNKFVFLDEISEGYG